MQLQNFYAQDVNGNIVPGATCALYLAGTTTLATGLQAANGSPLDNPFSANGTGLASVAAPQGVYDLKISSGFITSTIRIQFIDVIQVANDATAAAAAANAAASSAAASAISADQASTTVAVLLGPHGDSLISHTYPGTLPTTMTVEQVLNGLSIPVTANGAIADGSDATDAINRLIFSLPTGGTVDLLGRTFVVTSLNAKSRMRIRNGTLKTKDNAGAFSSPITLNGNTVAQSYLYLEDLEINGNRAGQSSITTPSAEDGGLHGIRLLGKCTNIYITRTNVYAAGSYGILLYSSTGAGSTDNVYTFGDVIISDSSFTGCRAHGGASDSTFGLRFRNVQLNNNGNDLPGSGSLPLTSGARGATTGGNYYGTGWDFEGYGLGSGINQLHLDSVTAIGNARNGILFFDQLDNRPAGFVARQKIWIDNCYFDKGIDPAGDGTALTFSSTITSKTLAALYDSIYITNTRLDGRLIARCVNNLQMQGEIIYSADAYFALLDYATNVKFDVTTPGSAKLVNSSNSTYTMAPNAAISAGNPVLSLLSGAGTLSSIVVTPIGGIVGQTYRYAITATWTGTAAGSPLFRITPAAGGVLAFAPRFEVFNSSHTIILNLTKELFKIKIAQLFRVERAS